MDIPVRRGPQGTPGPGAGLPVLDAGGFGDVRDAFGPGRAEAVADLVRMFATDAAEAVAAMSAACSVGDDEVRSRLAHRLRGSALTLGATQVAALCSDLEQGVAAPKDLRRLTAALDECVEAMRASL